MCTLKGLIAEHKFRVWVTMLGRMSCHFHFFLNIKYTFVTFNILIFITIYVYLSSEKNTKIYKFLVGEVSKICLI